MVCKDTFTKRRQEAFSLIEVLVTSVVSLIVLLAVAAFFFFSNRSFLAMTNYLELDLKTQLALDKMSKQIRQVNSLTYYGTNSLTFQDYDGGTLQYTYDPNKRMLTRTKGGTNEMLLTNCDSLKFSIFQRTPSNATFLPYSTTTATNTKVIELSWSCSRTILGAKVNTESMESAKVVIRNR